MPWIRWIIYPDHEMDTSEVMDTSDHVEISRGTSNGHLQSRPLPLHWKHPFRDGAHHSMTALIEAKRLRAPDGSSEASFAFNS